MKGLSVTVLTVFATLLGLAANTHVNPTPGVVYTVEDRQMHYVQTVAPIGVRSLPLVAQFFPPEHVSHSCGNGFQLIAQRPPLQALGYYQTDTQEGRMSADVYRRSAFFECIQPGKDT
ncbi:hypothetical protein [Marivivens marinus]|uniref:hypothetical protein n=1 Tax=Marivivens marinus TaxID=3110173 RepID=UPI003B848F46